MSDYIAVADCEDRRLYKIQSRNLTVGVFVAASKGFIGIREKLGSLFLFEEYHRDTGAPYGTVAPLEALDVRVPDEIQLSEYLTGPNGERIQCSICGRWAEQYRGNHYELPGPPFYRHLDEPEGYDVCKSEDDQNWDTRYGRAQLVTNRPLYALLEPLTDWVKTFEADIAAKRAGLQQ